MPRQLVGVIAFLIAPLETDSFSWRNLIMNQATILRIVLGAGLLPIAWSAGEAAAAHAFPWDDGVAPQATQSVLRVLPRTNPADLLLVQGGMRGRSGVGAASIWAGPAGKPPAGHPPKPHPKPGHWPHHHPTYIYPYPYTSYYTPGYTYDYSYSQPAPGVSVPAILPSNPLPSIAAGATGIQIVNPAQTGVPLTYRLNGTQYTLRAGEVQNLQLDRAWVIEFDRGGQFGTARYNLTPGAYTFSPTAQGWELYQQPALTR